MEEASSSPLSSDSQISLVRTALLSAIRLQAHVLIQELIQTLLTQNVISSFPRSDCPSSFAVEVVADPRVPLLTYQTKSFELVCQCSWMTLPPSPLIHFHQTSSRHQKFRFSTPSCRSELSSRPCCRRLKPRPQEPLCSVEQCTADNLRKRGSTAFTFLFCRWAEGALLPF